MLANNNKAIINKLAKNTVKTNKKQFMILFFTVALSAFMIFGVFTIGITYLDLSRLQNTRLFGAEYDATVINGFTEEQKTILTENPDIQSVGTLSYAGYVKSTDADDTINVGLIWCDPVYWEQQSAPARTMVEGSYPVERKELLVTKEALKECGKESLTLGDTLSMTYEDNTGIHTEDFVISGIWEGYGNQAIFYVSDAFFSTSGYSLEQSGILYIKYAHNFVTNHTINETEKSLSLNKQQLFQVSDYISNSLTILMGISGLGFIICLSAYLLIYNILYLSVSGKIRYYGLLQTLGMTKKQLVWFIRKQMFLIGISGIVIGVVLGIFTSIILVPYVMRVLGIADGNLELHFYPAVLLLSFVITAISIVWGIRTPIRMATNITPVEATKYRAYTSGGIGRKKSKHGRFFWKMALEQLKRDKKKTIVVFLSLATSLTVFYCLTTIISSYGERTVMPNYRDADLIIQNDTQTADSINSLQPALNKNILSELEEIKGIRDIHVLTGVPITIPYQEDGFSDRWLEGYLSTRPYTSHTETVSDYQSHPQNYYGMLEGIDEAEFDYLNQSLGTPVDKEDFMNGKVCIVQYAGFEISTEDIQNQNIFFEVQDKSYEIAIGSVSYESYYTSPTIGPSLIVSKEYLERLVSEPYLLKLNIKYEKTYDENTESSIMEILKNSPYSNDLPVLSKLEEMRTIQESQGNMQAIGTVIALLLLMVGVLNYVNTMASGIQNRKLTFSIMESIGMSRKQIDQLLIREGFLYAVFSIIITVTVGTIITYICFQSMNYMDVPFSVPIMPLICGILLLTVICIVAPLLSYRKISSKGSIIERLREYE